ncbi:MAG: alpha/beta fold hydrolase [Dehalococcoidia bacterium]|nr:alpha/beta fold hydrolase [Dehalococcoidia bacterium]
MPTASCNNIEIYYETSGDPAGPPVLLLQGMAMPLTMWSEGSHALAEQGFHVICLDHRDVGYSTRFDHGPQPDMAAVARGDFSSVPYSLDDMADDMAGLLDALGLQAAHICGLSMGAHIAQAMAIRHPRRVLSLVSGMSTTGDESLPRASPHAAKAMAVPAPAEREPYILYGLALAAALGSPGYPSDERRLRALFASHWDRRPDPGTILRHLAATVASGDRTARLGQVTAPTVVIHGTDDPLVSSAAGEAVAAAIPGARFVLVAGMGHEFDFVPLMPHIVDAITDNIRILAAAGDRQP